MAGGWEWVWVILGLCWVCSSTKKTVAGGWVGVILGLCWVYSSTKKTMAGCGRFWICVGSVRGFQREEGRK